MSVVFIVCGVCKVLSVAFWKNSVRVCVETFPFESVKPLNRRELDTLYIVTFAFCKLEPVEFWTVASRYHWTVMLPVAPESKPMSVLLKVLFIKITFPVKILISLSPVAVKILLIIVLLEPNEL